MNEHDETYERWRRARAEVEPPAPPDFVEQVMRRVRVEARPAAAGRGAGWRRALQWLDDHRWARAALVGGAAVVGVARLAALLAVLLALG